jgi:hypothetical protein
MLSKSKHRAYNPTPGLTMLQKLDNFWQSLTGYKLLFLTYAILSLPTWICIRAFHKMHDEKEKDEVAKSSTAATQKVAPPQTVGFWAGISVLFQNSDALLFFFLVFVVGVSSGVIENFAYVRIREVGGTGKDMGLSRFVSSLAGAPMFWFSGPLVEILGADRVIVLSLLSYVVRFLIYAFMQNPLQGLPAEALRGVTFAAYWSTATIYASRIAPPGMGATMVGARFGLERWFHSTGYNIISYCVFFFSAHVPQCHVWWLGAIGRSNRGRQVAIQVWNSSYLFVWCGI